MNDEAPFQPDRALFERWRSNAPAAADEIPLEDALELAAYLDGRLTADEAAAFEATLASSAWALETALDMQANAVTPEIPSAHFLARAQALVPEAGGNAEPETAAILPFRSRAARPAPRVARAGTWAAWGAVAASLILVSLAGFHLGIRTEQNFSTGQSQETPVDFLDQSGSLLGDGIG